MLLLAHKMRIRGFLIVREFMTQDLGASYNPTRLFNHRMQK